jgi:hypothetical protein
MHSISNIPNIPRYIKASAVHHFTLELRPWVRPQERLRSLRQCLLLLVAIITRVEVAQMGQVGPMGVFRRRQLRQRVQEERD